MSCGMFQETDYCKSCDDDLCALNGGGTDPHDMCGCELCEFHSMIGDRAVCINGEIVENAQKER